ncbi:MAG TPA: translational GTPase TypA [Gammaproteobacteria bacterium]|nr:translational GTPase TypA [Gammaproteobacteria bacterium]
MITALRNIAIIAHVDHGKTTLVDKLLQQSGVLGRHDQGERLMDQNDLEKERGITILSKVTAINWNDCRINIVDTPGHADFGGEVERILSMVDSVLLLVDAVEGPMPQTRFVTQKAFSQGLKPIVVVNKVDRQGARPDWVVDQIFDLFVSLDASDEQLDFPVIYASALKGFATLDLDQLSDDMSPLMELILQQVAAPQVDLEGPFQMQVSSLDYSSYTGAIAIGRVNRGQLAPNSPVSIVNREGAVRRGKVLTVFNHEGLKRVEAETAIAGDIVCLTGIEEPKISDTICALGEPCGLPSLTVDEPTISIHMGVNQSPFAGQDGKFLTARHVRERLLRECIHNVALRVEDTASPEQFKVSGRGELHLTILIEQMRREGYEMAVARPEVILKEVDGVLCEPYELLVVDVATRHQGAIMECLGARKAELKDMVMGQERVNLSFILPTRALMGFQSELLTLTSGTGLLSRIFNHYGPCIRGDLASRKQGVLIANATGPATGYALFQLQARGKLMIGPQADVYEGMIVGIHSRDNDLVVNVQRKKQLTNVRASGTDENIVLTPPVPITLESALEFINSDELVEVTPKNIRLRKKWLKDYERKRQSRE